MKKFIHTDPQLCNGCRICILVCSLEKSGKFNQFNSGVWIEADEMNGSNMPHVCRQCWKPACVKACPAQRLAQNDPKLDPPIYRDEEKGIVWLDTKKESCIGCYECMLSCPFGFIRINFEDQQLVKCDLCGGDPECVKYCPTGAIKYIEFGQYKPTKAAT